MSSTPSLSACRLLCGLVLIGLLLISLSVESQARYLPTRSDPSRREQIRELLRALLDLSPGEGIHGGYAASSGYEYGPAGPTLKGLDRSD